MLKDVLTWLLLPDRSWEIVGTVCDVSVVNVPKACETKVSASQCKVQVHGLSSAGAEFMVRVINSFCIICIQPKQECGRIGLWEWSCCKGSCCQPAVLEEHDLLQHGNILLSIQRL